jgi:hypothetical protein
LQASVDSQQGESSLERTAGFSESPFRSIEEILQAYPYLEAADIYEALTYAAWSVEEIEVLLALTCLQQFQLELETGALLTIDSSRSRVRILPIG